MKEEKEDLVNEESQVASHTRKAANTPKNGERRMPKRKLNETKEAEDHGK